MVVRAVIRATRNVLVSLPGSIALCGRLVQMDFHRLPAEEEKCEVAGSAHARWRRAEPSGDYLRLAYPDVV